MRDILQAGLKVGTATLAGLLAWVVAGKVLALMLGAAGIGLFGLLRQLLLNLTILGSFNGQMALVQGIASRTTPAEQLRFSGSVLRLQALIAGALALVLAAGAPWLGPPLIPHPQAVVLIRWLAVAVLVMVAQGYALGLLNGHRLLDDLVKTQMLGPLSVLILVFPMIWLVQRGNAFGFVLLLVGPAMVVTLSAAWKASRAGWLPRLRDGSIHGGDAASFFRVSSILLATAGVTTGAQFCQSWMVARRMGLAQSGQFWTAWSLSMSYVTLVLGSFGTYYMPSLSGLKDPEARRNLIRSYLFLSLRAMPLLVASVVVFKPWAILGLFSPALLPSLKVMRWMLIGDYFKGISWVLGLPMLAFNEMKWFFWSEVLLALAIASLAWAWLQSGGGIGGLGALFLLCYVVHLPAMALYLRLRHGFVWRPAEEATLMAGLALVISVSVFTWRDEHVRWSAVGLLAVLGGGFLAVALRGVSWRRLLPGRNAGG